MDSISLFFMDVWTFVWSQLGLLAIGALGGAFLALFFAGWLRRKALTLLGVEQPAPPVDAPAQP